MPTETTTAEIIDKVDLTKLLPNFKLILNGFPQTAEELSAWFITILLCVFSFFLLYSSVWKSIKTHRQINWLKNLLNGHNSETIADNRQTFIDQAKKVKHTAGHLWREFDETLIEGTKNDKIYLYNTYDSAHFFNSETLASGITGSRLVAAVPGFLTAIGVIGTFVGLQLGLAELNIANNVSVDDMKSGVAGVINGAKIAFITSVWGVFLSVLFNISEKVFERLARTRITRLQNLIDKLFDRISPEEQLQRIADDGKQSRESLQGLAEKIGLKMQESLIQATEGIQSGLEASLEKIMAPAIDKLVDETSDGNKKALENLLGQFMDKFGAEGNQQRQAMDDASEKMNASLALFGTSMQAFLDKMEISRNSVAQKEEEMVQNISSQVSWLVENTSAQNKILTEFIENTFGELSVKLNDRDQLIADRERIRGEEFINQTNAMKNGTAELLQRIDKGLKTQFQETKELLSQGQALQSSIKESVSANVQATGSMRDTSSELNSTVNKLNTFGKYIHQAGNKLSETIAQAVTTTEKLAKENQNSTSEIKRIFDRILEGSKEFNNLIQKMQSLVNTADKMFENLDDQQHEYLARLKQNVEELAAKMTNLLKDYANQANGQTNQHLKVWAEGTTQYTTSMNNAAQALASVVDDIEVKLGR